MEKKLSSKHYLIGAIILVVVIIIVAAFLGRSKSSKPIAPTASPVNAPMINTPAPSAAAPAPAPQAPATAPVANSAPTSGLIGTWVSATKGKGMQGSGKITFNGSTDQIALTSDVNLVVQQVVNNTGTGTITFSNSCLTATVSVPGKPNVTNPTQCAKTFSQPAVMQISGNTISYSGKSELGANISLTGTFTGDSMTGTFTRTSLSGKVTGTFDLVRQ